MAATYVVLFFCAVTTNVVHVAFLVPASRCSLTKCAAAIDRTIVDFASEGDAFSGGSPTYHILCFDVDVDSESFPLALLSADFTRDADIERVVLPLVDINFSSSLGHEVVILCDPDTNHQR